ncbi:MAG: M48 family metalloprotease, partial [Sphingomonadaceae bacterium]|nr:M48 family metalloprotease [Sphingomonadaceae bacterium]
GMSDRLGPLQFGKKQEMIFLGREISEQKDYSERTAEAIDEEVHSLVQGAYDHANKLLEENIDRLHALAGALLDREILDRDEIEGVMAHELAHVRNRDTLIMTMAATIAGAISMLGSFAYYFRGGGGRAGIAALVAVLLAPFAAMIIQMAISRTREYGADRGGAEISGKPAALATALAKLASGAAQVPNPVAQRNPAAAHLYIVPSLFGGMAGLFSTHPDTGKRIAELEKMAMVVGADRRPSSPSGYIGESPARRGSALDPHGRRR